MRVLKKPINRYHVKDTAQLTKTNNILNPVGKIQGSLIANMFKRSKYASIQVQSTRNAHISHIHGAYGIGKNA